MAAVRLIGRRAECRRLDELLAGAGTAGGVLVLRGEPGIGKSALLRYAIGRAERLGHRVLAVEGVEAEATLPYAGLHRLAQPLLAGAGRLPEPQQAALDVAFGVRRGDPPSPFLVGLAFLQLLSDAAESAPVVVVVDDAHWLDRSSADVLAFVARRVGADPVVVLGATRDGEPLALLGGALPEMTLGRLDHVSAEALLDGQRTRLKPAARTRVLDEAAGNPLALVELPIAWTTSGDPTPANSAMPLTKRLEIAFAARVEHLPPATRRALLVAAVDDGNDVEEILEATARLESEAGMSLDVLGPAEAAGLVALDGGKVRFSHPLTRSGVLQATGTAERHAAHAALAALLEHDPERQVWHRAASHVGPDEPIAGSLEQASEHAKARGAVAVAIEALERAAHFTPASAERGRRLLDAAALAQDVGDPQLMERLIGEAADTGVSGADRVRLLWLREERDPHGWSGSERVRSFAEHARQVAAAGDAELALRSMLTVALRLWWSNPTDDLRGLVVDVANAVDVDGGHPAVIAVLAYADPLRCGATVLDRIAALRPEELHDPAAMYLVGSAATAVWAPDVALPFFEAASEGLRAQGRLGLLTQTLVSDAWAALHLAQGHRAEAAADEALRLAHDTGQPRWGIVAQLARATIAAERGDAATADALAGQAEAALMAAGAYPMLALVQFTRGRGAIAHQRYAEGLGHLRRILDPADLAYQPLVGAWGLSDLVEASLRLGDHAAAGKYLRRLETHAAAAPGALLRVQLAYARALAAEDGDARTAYERALNDELVGWPCYRGRLLLAYGAWLRRRRRVGESRAPLRAARETFDALGFDGLSVTARQELRASGETSRHRPRSARDELSPQELQIAQLAARGMTNKEIAQRLFLSHRTVGSHLYRLYPKLGISSRAELRDALGDGRAQPAPALG